LATYLRKNKDSAKKFAEVLEKGGIVLHPTDTVYGLAAHGWKRKALEKLALLKGRSWEKPFLVLSSEAMLEELVSEIPESLRNLWEDFISKPITAILPARRDFPYITSRGKIAVRIPSDQFLLEVLQLLRAPIASTSANPAGLILPQEESINYFSERVDLVILGKTGGGLPSTIIDFTIKPPKLIREGAYKFSTE